MVAGVIEVIEIYLIHKLNKYEAANNEHGFKDLNEEGQKILYRGIEEYQRKSGHPPPHFEHRLRFLAYAAALSQNRDKEYKGDDDTRKNTPEKATITVENLFDKEGLKLYRLALEEEMNSYEYRQAVFNESTVFIEGQTWEKPPLVMIGGPSGCGKSYASDAIINELHSLPKGEDDSGNLLACIDGGVCRAVSQMRTLAIRIANYKGFTGLEDLHHHSAVLEDVKKIMKDAALADTKFGLVIPETFSEWINPFKKYKPFMEEMAKSENRTFIFALVEGENEESFKDVVYFMGTRRAWKTDGFDNVILDLNDREEIDESKKYQAEGFWFGVMGSGKASDAYVIIQRNNGNPDLRITVKNDLILLRREKGAVETWVPGKVGDDKLIIVSKSVYTEWNKLPHDEKKKMDFVTFSKNNSKTHITKSPELELLLTQKRLQSENSKEALQKMKGLAAPKDEPIVEREEQWNSQPN